VAKNQVSAVLQVSSISRLLSLFALDSMRALVHMNPHGGCVLQMFTGIELMVHKSTLFETVSVALLMRGSSLS
jgi:hypothetical protein